MVATFVTIPASNYVEKARWALQLTGVPFTEHKYAPLLAYVSTMPNGGKSVPLLVLPGSGDAKDANKPRVLTDSSEILDYCATKLPELYPTLKTKELELLYDKALGPHTRRCAYHILFADSAAGRQIIAGPLGFFQYYVTYLLYPMLKALLKRGLNVNAKAAERSWEKIELMLKEVEERLGDGPIGAQFLDGNKFSAADITLCAHLSLLLFPPQHSYIGRQMSVERIKDPVFKQRIEKLQRSKVGKYVYWCYENRRPPMLPKAKL